MTRARVVLILAITFAGCGKKGPPLAPFQPDPQAVASLKIGQQGNQLAVDYVSPRQTVDAQPLAVHDVEILVASRPGDMAKVAQVHTVRVAPGETRTELLPLPEVDTTVRVAARARNKGRRSPISRTFTLVVQPAPAAPTDVRAEVDPAGVVITWTTPAPTPTRTPTPSPSPAPTATPAPGTTPGAATATPRPSPTPVTGYLLRRRGPSGTTELTQKPIVGPPFLDDAVVPVGRWCYTVRRVVATEPLVTSAESPEGCVDVKVARPPAVRPVP